MQIQSFVAEEHTFSPRRKKSEPNEQRTLVAFLDTDSWLEDGYSVYWRASDGSQSTEGPTATELSSVFENRGEFGIALLAREDCLEEVTAANPFEPGDLIIALIKANQMDYFVRRFSEFYNCALPASQPSNLPEQYLLIYCGRLSNGRFFDPLGRRTKIKSSRVLELTGGLIADGRSHTFLAGYPPCELKYNGNVLPSNTEIAVNGLKWQVASFFQKLENQKQLASYIVEFREGRSEFKISPTRGLERGQLLFGFPLENKQLGPTAIALNEGQSSLRGAFFLENLEENEEPIPELTTADLITMVSKGERVWLSNHVLDPLLDTIRLSTGNPQLIDIALRQLQTTRSIPIKALKTKCIRKLRLRSIREGSDK